MKSTNREESLAAAIADGEKRGLKQGFGEIIDEGQLSKVEIAALHPVLDPEDDAAVDRYIAENDFSDIGLGKLDRFTARQHMVMANLRRLAQIKNAPEEHIYDFRYHP